MQLLKYKRISLAFFVTGCIVVFACPDARSQSAGEIKAGSSRYTVRHYDASQGLVSSEVVSLFKDKSGALWISTFGGLSRFDGSQFQNYNYLNGLTETNIDVFDQDEQGNIFISSATGFFAFTGNKLAPFKRLNAGGEVIQAVAYAGAGDFWINYKEYNKIILLRTQQAVMEIKADAIIESMYRCADGAVYVLDREGGVYVLRAQRLEKIFMLQPRGDHVPNGFKMHRDPEGKIYTYTANENYIYQYRDGKRSDSIYVPAFKEWWKYSVSRSTVFYASDAGELYRLANRKWELVCDRQAVAGTLYSIYSFNNRDIWLGTITGLYKLSPKRYISTRADGTGYHYEVSKSGKYLMRLDSSVLQTSRVKAALEQIRREKITNTYLARNKDLWFATEFSVYCLSQHGALKRMNTDVTYHGKNAHFRFRRIIEDSIGGVWASSYNGIFYFKNDVPRYYFFEQGLTEYAVYNLLIDNKGILYVAGAQLFGLVGDKFVNISKALGLPVEIHRLATDNAGNLWTAQGYDRLFKIGYNGSSFFKADSVLLRLDGKAFLSSAIAFDSYNNMWLTDDETLYCYPYRGGRFLWQQNPLLWREQLRGHPLLYSNDDGGLLLHRHPAEGNYVRQYDARQLIATYHRPQAVVSIEELKLNRLSHDWRGEGYPLNDKGLPLNLSLKPDQNFIEFSFSAVTANLDDGISYRYRLVGFDADWSPPVTEPEAAYTGLPAGIYRFEVQAKAPGAEWGVTTQYPFSIQSVWYKTPVALILFFLAGIAVTFLLLRWRVRSIAKKNQLKFALAQEQLKRLRMQINPHFLQNIFASLAHAVYHKDQQQLVKTLDLISIFLRKLLILSDQSSTTLENELELAEDYIALKKYLSGKELDYSIEIAPEVDPFDIQLPPMLLQPIIENAIKYGISGEPGFKNTLKVKIVKAGATINIQISDSGKPVHHQQPARVGTGKGLELSRQQLDVFYAGYKQQPDYYFITNESGGRTVTLILPLS